MNLLLIGSISGCLVVILGAFGAHYLKNVLDDYTFSIYEKAILYQMFHTVAILFLAILEKIISNIQLQFIGLVFFVGIIIFSGSLYLIALTGIRSFGALTPIGGLLFIIGWILLALKAF